MNVKAIDPDKAWGLFQGWAAGQLRDTAPGTCLTLVDYPALRRKDDLQPFRRGAWLYPMGFLQARNHRVKLLSNGFWIIDGETVSVFKLLDVINQHRIDEGQAPVGLEDLRGIER